MPGYKTKMRAVSRLQGHMHGVHKEKPLLVAGLWPTLSIATDPAVMWHRP